MKSDSKQDARWWIFDKPLRRDPLFLTAIVVMVVGFVGILVEGDVHVGRLLLLDIPLLVASSILLVGATLGSIREYRRGTQSR